MKAILVEEDRSLRWADVEDPICSKEDCLIRIEAAALNRADLMQREGDYPPPPGCPEWMGLEVSGEIVEIGETARQESQWKVGDKVCALLGGGGYAQYVNVKYDMLMPVPKNCSMVEAAALPEAYATAYLNLFLEAGIRKGETLLVTAGGSGLASVMIPMAKAFGIRVLTTVRSDEKARAIEHLGADCVINTRKISLHEALKEEMEKGCGVDVAIDCVGGEEMGKCIPFLNRGARWVMIAALGGAETEIDLKQVYVRNVRIIGSTLRSRAPEVKAQILKKLTEEIWPLIENGKIRPTIDNVFHIEEAQEAQQVLYDGRNVGKVVMTVS